jgi:predicted outer membrane repeat protein
VDGVEIWVAEGVYTPTLEFSPGDPRSATFQLRNGVALYGGFDPSAGDIDWGDRDWVRNLTVLSGERGSPDNSDNCYHVFYHPEGTDLNGTSILDGFMLTGGNADADYGPYGVGGGMYNDGSSPMLTNCTFSGNSSGYGGGGIYNHGASPVVTRCTFSDNSTTGCGGGISNDWGSTMSVTDCTFSNNVADMGGGMCNGESSPAVANCAFSGNSARLGAGVYNRESSPAVTNCSLSLNLASGCGGGLFNLASSPALTNCTFSGNSATSFSGGGICNSSSSSPALTNCILWGDTPQEIYSYDMDSVPVVTYSDIQGGYSGTGNIDDDPLFVDAASDDFHLGLDSPCIDVGNNDAPILPDVDFEGHTRIADGDCDGTATVDMGVDEVLLRGYLPLILRGE